MTLVSAESVTHYVKALRGKSWRGRDDVECQVASDMLEILLAERDEHRRIAAISVDLVRAAKADAERLHEAEGKKLKKTIEALTADRDQLYEGWNACRSLALETIARAEAAEAERDALTAERDTAVADFAALKLAIAVKGGNEHAPTQDAYDAACRALGKHRARAEAAEAELKALTAELDQLYEGLNAWPRSLALATLARAEAAEAERDAMAAENNRLREELTKAADSLGWADAHLEDAGVISAQVRYGEKQARAALKGEQK